MIKNINYKGRLSPTQMRKINFYIKPFTPSPHQLVVQLEDAKLLVFPSGKCRIMGIKIPITEKPLNDLPVEIKDLEIQSATLVFTLGHEINLIHLTKILPAKSFLYEPELFPALRLLTFNPMCVNVFGTGKVVVLGLKDLTNQNQLCRQICNMLSI